MSAKKLHVQSIFEVIHNQHQYLKERSQDIIDVLNQISDDLEQLKEKHNITCLLFHNCGEHLEFDISLQIIDKELNFHANYKYEMELNDGESFGIDHYEDEIEEYPVPDYFSEERGEFLNQLLFQFFIECFWNSKLFHADILCIYSHTTDCDSLVKLNGDLTEYTSLESILASVGS